MAYNQKIEMANKQIRFVTAIGVVFNVILGAVKVAVGLAGGSMALIADGLHSFSDMVTDLAVLLGVYLGSKQPDRKHPYGHGRIETFSTVFIAFILSAVGSAMIYRAALGIAKGQISRPTAIVSVVAIISIFAKELLYRITRTVAVRTHSAALYANAWHHRSDALSSVAVLIGVISLKVGFIYGDQIAAVAIGLMIIFVGVHITGECFREFIDAAVDSGTIERIERIIASNGQVRQWHKLRTRTVGREVFLDLHILVDPWLTVTAAHEISERLENTIHEQITRPVNVIVHIEPDKGELRK